MIDDIGTGTYVLVFEITGTERNRLGQFGGCYCYVGSAFGPGGIRARVSRHLRRDKPTKWHIDTLTGSPLFRPISIRTTGKRIECELAESISRSWEGHPGFGASDCGCPTHLFRVPYLPGLDRALDRFGMTGFVPADFLS